MVGRAPSPQLYVRWTERPLPGRLAGPLPRSSMSPALSAPSRGGWPGPRRALTCSPPPTSSIIVAMLAAEPQPYTVHHPTPQACGQRSPQGGVRPDGTQEGLRHTDGAQPPGPLPPGRQRALRGFRAQVSSCLSRGGRILGPVRNGGRTEAPLHQNRSARGSAVLPGSPCRPGLLGQLSRGGLSSLVLHSWLPGGTWEASGLTLN